MRERCFITFCSIYRMLFPTFCSCRNVFWRKRHEENVVGSGGTLIFQLTGNLHIENLSFMDSEADTTGAWK